MDTATPQTLQVQTDPQPPMVPIGATQMQEINGPPDPSLYRYKDGVPVYGKNGKPLKRPGPPLGYKKPPKTEASVPAPAPAESQIPPKEEAHVPQTTTPEPAPTPDPVALMTAVMASSFQTPAPPPPPEAPKVSPTPEKRGFVVPDKISVLRTVGKIGAQEVVADENIEVKAFAVQPAQVDVGYGLTLNLGNYETARVDVRVSLPCYREEIEGAYESAREFAEARVKAECANIRSFTKQKNTQSPF